MRQAKALRLMLRIFLFLTAVLIMLPLLFTLANSLMSPAEVLDRYANTVTPGNFFDDHYGDIHYVNPTLLPSYPTLKQHLTVLFFSPDIMRAFWISLGVAAVVVAGQCAVSAPAAYFFERARFRGKELLFFLYLVVMLLPMQVVLVPNFIVAVNLGLSRSYLAIILPGIAAPFGTFLIRQQMRGFPTVVYEAAQIDGAGKGSIFLRIFLPAAVPSVASLAFLTFVEYWNLIDQAVVFIRETWRQPLSVYLGVLMGQKTEIYFAACVLFMVPPLLVFVMGQEHLRQGIQLSGLKA